MNSAPKARKSVQVKKRTFICLASLFPTFHYPHLVSLTVLRIVFRPSGSLLNQLQHGTSLGSTRCCRSDTRKAEVPVNHGYDTNCEERVYGHLYARVRALSHYA